MWGWLEGEPIGHQPFRGSLFLSCPTRFYKEMLEAYLFIVDSEWPCGARPFFCSLPESAVFRPAARGFHPCAAEPCGSRHGFGMLIGVVLDPVRVSELLPACEGHDVAHVTVLIDWTEMHGHLVTLAGPLKGAMAREELRVDAVKDASA